jgi:hypothetical protein
MRHTKLTASTAALLLSSTALLAQEAQSQAYQSVFVDVGGTAVLVPLYVALEACGLDETTLQTVAQTRFQESGADESQFYAQMESAMGLTGQGGVAGSGDAAMQDTAAAGTAGTGAGDASGTMGTEGGTASADAGGATGAAGTTGGAASTDAATADAGATTDAGAASGTGDTTQTANANMTTDAGNTTTDAGNTTDTATADASGAAAGDASGAAADTGTTDMATADASGATGQDATATAAGEVQNVESTAADTTGDAGAMGAANADPFLLLATCQIDLERATELQVDMTRTGQGLGFDAGTLGIQSGTAIQ